MTLSILIWLPVAIALVAALLAPAHHVGRTVAVLSLVTLGIAISFIARFKLGHAGLQFVTNKVWISALGIHYKLGLDGLNVALIVLACVLFCASLIWSSFREWDRPRLFYFHFGLAQSAVLGAFCAQDLALFVAFFDLMLIPFYFLTGSWGTGDRVRATTKLVVYTLIGSFFMLAGAVATGVLASNQHGTSITFVISTLQHLRLSHTSQDWIFLAFAAAFLVKMPLVPFHGWLPDGYKSMPIPAVAVFSGVVSKVAAYGFLRIVLPLFPYAAVHFQLLMLVIALVSILYATSLAFTTDDARLVVGYSSIAQLGFITLGIFSLRTQGAQGALLQMLNHGLVTAPLFFIVAALAARAGGSEKLRDMGGIAFRAPVLATLFLIVALATLAMPGSSNFVGEFMILLGVFKSKLAIAIIAFTGVVGASFYALRVFIGAMQNRVGPKVSSREIGVADVAALAPIVLVILVFAFYPQFALKRSEPTVNSTLASAQLGAPGAGGRAMILLAHIHGPHIDWAGLSPFVALAAGGLVVLLVGLLSPAWVRERVVPLLTIGTLAAALFFEIRYFKHHASIISGALRIDDLALTLDMVFAGSALAATLMSWREPAAESAGHGEYHALMIFSVLGMAVLVSAQNLVTLFLGFELLSIPLYVLCAAAYRREGSLEAGLKYLVIGSVGSATLVYGLALVYGATGSTDFSAIATATSTGKLAGGVLGDPMLYTGIGLVIVGFAFKASVAPFHQWTPDVYEGAPTPVTAFMATATKAAALGVFIRFFGVAVIGAQNTWAPLLAALATITILVGNIGALGQSSLKRMLGYSGVAQAGYMLGGVVVGTQLGIQAIVLYIAVYLAMNLAAFAVIVAVERDDERGDDIAALGGLGRRQPWLAWPMTIAMLALAGIPGTAGFIGKFQLIHALVAGDYTWLAIVLVVGSMISLGYYLRVVATMWMGGATAPEPAYAPIAGGSPEADAALPRPDQAVPYPEVALVAVLFAASVFFGIFPEPLFHLASHAGQAISSLVP